MVGTCTGCGTENVEINEAGLCAACAASQAAPSTEGTETTTEGTL